MTVPEDKALLAIQLLVEGTSVRTVERITQLHRDTILRLLVLASERCIALMDTQMRNLQCKRIQADEIWSFVGKKQRHVKVDDPDEIGDAWVFVSLDAQTKLIPSYMVGKRDRATTYAFLTDLRDRMAEEHRFQITTDGFVFYRKGVENVFAGQADFAQMIKLYGDYGSTMPLAATRRRR
jgi:IS1 family transposase